jgi:hypothetical protein
MLAIPQALLLDNHFGQQQPDRHEPASEENPLPTLSSHSRTMAGGTSERKRVPESAAPLQEDGHKETAPEPKSFTLRLEGCGGQSIVIRGEHTNEADTAPANPELNELEETMADYEFPSLLESSAVQLVLELAAKHASDAQDRVIARVLANWLGCEDVNVLELVDSKHPQHCVAPVIKYFLDAYPLTWRDCNDMGMHEGLCGAKIAYKRLGASARPCQIRWSVDDTEEDCVFCSNDAEDDC